jgi:hypothetical protein
MEGDGCRVTPLKSVDQPVPARTYFSHFSPKKHIKRWSHFSGGTRNPGPSSVNPIVYESQGRSFAYALSALANSAGNL